MDYHITMGKKQSHLQLVSYINIKQLPVPGAVLCSFLGETADTEASRTAVGCNYAAGGNP